MSFGLALPDISYVVPDVDYPPPPRDAPPDELPTTGEVGQVIADHLVELAGATLLGLGALSGALLAARAAMAGPQSLADAAARATEAQDSEQAGRAEELWRDALFAVARANARIDTLRARSAAASPGDEPDSPAPGGDGPAPAGPGGPPLPAALDPTGLRLPQVHAWLAATDRAVRAAEAEFARRTLSAAPAAPDPTGAAALRDRRARALAGYAAADDEAAAAAALPPCPSALPDGTAVTAESVTELGAELLAGLELNVRAVEFTRIETVIGHAVELASSRPVAATHRLAEARDLAFAANWRAADRRETAEWAAQQLRVLRTPWPMPPDDSAPSTPAAELALLETVLTHGGPVTPRQRAEVAGRVAEREAALGRLYVTQLIRRTLAARARETGELTVTQVALGIQHLEWAPAGWGDEHWLRLVVDPAGVVRLLTMHRIRGPHEDTDAAHALDHVRCQEAGAHLSRLVDAAAAAGLPLDAGFGEDRPVAGTRHPGARGHRPEPPRRARADRPAPLARRHPRSRGDDCG
ncbi:hypothetical protein RM844_22215 [Streptomyces sp. DSM 44915]|uniref:DUF222 domain-containing protein n=1 Tax=Streptomyces chisholmiae TaxID=3075540 RepID=A0ABU2JWA2_9ACTN|nr:hypothetical protein [Streptomyces sp. DSM 44915]MDT0269004.1 hypothetical protein [Streptomyces sp. DSM 44915]